MLNLPLAPLWAKLLRVPRPYLYAGILFFSSLGAYSVNAQAFDLVLLFLLGLLGFMMRRYGLPVLPLIIGVILGPRRNSNCDAPCSSATATSAACEANRWPSPSTSSSD